MEESRSVTPWVNRLYFESPRASSFLGLRLVKARHKNLVPLFSGVKPDPMLGSGRYAESIPVKSPLAPRHNQHTVTIITGKERCVNRLHIVLWYVGSLMELFFIAWYTNLYFLKHCLGCIYRYYKILWSTYTTFICNNIKIQFFLTFCSPSFGEFID